MSRSLVTRAEPCPTIAIPPTTTKSTPCATRRFRSAAGRNSGQFSTASRPCEREVAEVRVAALEAHDPLTRRQPEPLRDERLVDVAATRNRLHDKLAAARGESSPECGHAGIRLTRLEPRDCGLGGSESPSKLRLAQPCSASGIADDCHSK